MRQGFFWKAALIAIVKKAPLKLLTILLDRRGADVLITEKVVVAAAANYGNSKEVMTLLLDRRGADVPITEEVVAAIVRGFDKDVMTLLLDRRGADVPITEEVVKAAAANDGNGKDVMALLLDKRGADVPITEKVLEKVIFNTGNGKEVMTLLLDRREKEVIEALARPIGGFSLTFEKTSPSSFRVHLMSGWLYRKFGVRALNSS
ncbi:uncharacterized protein ALTATR162_LOCUS7816 [Alternaria atra]|uniref:Ankyrin repeat protein n=1 Tax=Alternaria atra TaxID=119953 RepID=A0A8J2I990_9PLEO|nr:uncharacterized protein ALTATR162_LOCUS7816 [Alternaria atra]CAG5174576.1 unnamed protein product [Alternaria atra]